MSKITVDFVSDVACPWCAVGLGGLLTAIERLSQGQPVTRVALDLGYASPSAFTSAFRRVLGQAPGAYLAAQR